MAVVGKDVPPEEGMRVLITEEGRAWDINKAKRGDSSQGRLGSIVELREGGQVCRQSDLLLAREERTGSTRELTPDRPRFSRHSREQISMVQWDHGGDVMPYPTGILNRFYLALDPEACAAKEADAPTAGNESLSLSLVDDLDETLSPIEMPSSSQATQPSSASGRKRKGAAQTCAVVSPSKKPSSSREGKDKKSIDNLADDGSAPSSTPASHDVSRVGAGGAADGSGAQAGEGGEEEELVEEGPDAMLLLIDGKWRKIAMIPPSAPSKKDEGGVLPARNRARRGLSFGERGRDCGGEENVQGDEDEDMLDAAVDKDANTFLSFLERAVSSRIYLSSLAEMTRSRCFCPKQFSIDTRFLDRAAGRLPADHIVYYTRHYIDAALSTSERSPEDLEALAFADKEEEEEADDGEAAGARASSKAKAKGGKGRKPTTPAKGAGKSEGELLAVVERETAMAALDAACVLLTTGCSSELQQQVLGEESIMAALQALLLILRQHSHAAESASTATTPSRRKSSGGGAGGPGSARSSSQRASAGGGSLCASASCALAALACLARGGVLSEEALFVARKVGMAALVYPGNGQEGSVRLDGAQLGAALAALDARTCRDTLADLYETMVSQEVSAGARGTVRLWGNADGVVVSASCAALLLLCQVVPAPRASRGRDAPSPSASAGLDSGECAHGAEGSSSAKEGSWEGGEEGERSGRRKSKCKHGKSAVSRPDGGVEQQDDDGVELAGLGAAGCNLCKMFFDLVGHRSLGRGRSGQAKDTLLRETLLCLLLCLATCRFDAHAC